MGTYPTLVDIAWRIVEKFIEDWQSEPYRWSGEKDIQAELCSRINSVYRLIGRDTVRANYPSLVPGFAGKWNRVCCEPSINYTYKDGKNYKCRPDIAIWDDVPDPDSPLDAVTGHNFPMLWACEIKLKGKELKSEKERWDEEKMNYLLHQGDLKYGCWLKFLLQPAQGPKSITWQKSYKNERLWVGTIMLPGRR